MKHSIRIAAAAALLLASASAAIAAPVATDPAVAAAAAATPDNALSGKRILFVVGKTGPNDPNDDPIIKEYMEGKGAQVTLAAAGDPASAARGADLVVISSTADARVLGNRYADLETPVVSWNAYSFPLLNMTGDKLHQDFSVVREKPFHNENHADYYAHAVSSTNPILAAAKLPAGMFAPLMFSAGVTDPSWGKASKGADIAVIFGGDRDQAAVFSYERGAAMNAMHTAPARRVGLFLGDNSFSVLSDVHGPAAEDPKEFAWFGGRRLFDAALRYAVSSPAALPAKRSYEQQIAETSALAKGKTLAFVRRFDLPWPENERGDQEQIKFYESLGFKVRQIDHMDSEAAADGADIIVLSASCNKYKLGMKHLDAKVPVILLEAKAVDALNMVSRLRNTDYGVNDHKESLYPPENYVNMMRPAHPISGGLPAGQFKLFTTPGVLAWSRPPAGATIIASIPNQPDHATMFVYDKGAMMAYDKIAPARRVLFPMDAPRFPDLTPEGRQLYASVVKWALSQPGS